MTDEEEYEKGDELPEYMDEGYKEDVDNEEPPEPAEPVVTEEEVKEKIKRDRERREAAKEDEDAVMGMLSANMNISEISNILRMDLREVAVIKRRFDERKESEKVFIQDIPEPKALPPPAHQPHSSDFVSYLMARNDKMEDRLMNMQNQQTNLIMKLITEGGGGGKEGFFDGEVGDLIKTKLVTNLFNMGGGQPQSEWVQVLNTLVGSGELRRMAREGMGLLKDIANKDNPNYNPFQNVEEEEMEEMDIVEYLTKKHPKVPQDIRDITLKRIEKENITDPEKIEEYYVRVIKGLEDLKDGCLALKNFVIEGDRTVEESAKFLSKTEYADLLKRIDLDAWYREAEHYKDTRSMGRYVRFLKNPKVKEKIKAIMEELKKKEVGK
uniref:Uncharacterized protein n=1 Tax=viral metagenome TaxID=1070528 RepID=A0A6M3Y0S0_9ZZZZ